MTRNGRTLPMLRRLVPIAFALPPTLRLAAQTNDPSAVASASAVTNQPLPFVPGSWTLVVLPDTQVYSNVYPGLFELQTYWIGRQKEALNIKYVVHLGDMVEYSKRREWEVADRAFRNLDGVMPYALVPGNHDYGEFGNKHMMVNLRATTLFNEFFPVARFRDWPTFGGVAEPGKMENAYHRFKAGGERWLILALEVEPRDIIIRWADRILASHPDHHAVIITHSYLYPDNTRADKSKPNSGQMFTPMDPAGGNDGEQIWQKLLRRHPNVLVTLNGHFLDDGLGYLASAGDHGNQVHQILVNFQMNNLGGGAYLRLLEFLPDGPTIQCKTYSPLYDRYLTDPANQFVLSYAPLAGRRRH